VAASQRPQGQRKSRDPICGIIVEKDPELSAEYGRTIYYFCSKTDRDQFRKNPRKYIH
jgi:YHS domain-containing protein